MNLPSSGVGGRRRLTRRSGLGLLGWERCGLLALRRLFDRFQRLGLLCVSNPFRPRTVPGSYNYRAHAMRRLFLVKGGLGTWSSTV